MLNEGDVWKMPKKGYINDQEMLLWPENSYIKGLKKISEENIIMKHDLQVFVRKSPIINEKWTIWAIYKFQIRKQSPKLESRWKTE